MENVICIIGTTLQNVIANLTRRKLQARSLCNFYKKCTIKEKANCSIDIGCWIRLQFYPDELCFNLFNAANEILGIDTMKAFGEYFGSFYLVEHGYKNVLRCKNRSLKEWLNSINDMHDNFKSRLPEFVAPEFSCIDDIEDENEEAIILHYYSYRGKLLAPVVVGMVMEVAKNSFNMVIRMDQIATQDENGSRFTSWRISLVCLLNTSLDANTSLLRQTSKKKNGTTSSVSLPDGHPGFTTGKGVGGTCPFSAGKSRVNTADFPSFMRPATEERGTVPHTARNPFSVANSKSHLSLNYNSCHFTPRQLQEVFPFHIAVDRNFMVLQEGSKLPSYLKGISSLGLHIGNIFQLKFPRIEWDWSEIKLNLDISFEMRLANTTFVTDMLTAYSKGQILNGDRSNAVTSEGQRSSANASAQASARPSADLSLSAADVTYRKVQHLSLKGGVYICDPAVDPSVTSFCAFFLVNPKVHNLSEMLMHNVSLPDFPRHSCQRDFALLGDHLMSETRIAVQLDIMNKQLDKELAGALEDSEGEKLIARQRSERLQELPIHRAVIEKAPEDVVIEKIKEHPETLFEKDFDGKTAFEHCLESDGYYEAVLKIVRDRLPFDPVTKHPAPSDKHGFVWTKVVQSFKYAKIVKTIIDEFLHISHELAHSKDEEGRPAVYIASPLCQQHIKESLYFFRRYEIHSLDVPHHKSATCTLYIAVDRANNDQRVALKFMAIKEQYIGEQEIRKLGNFHEDYVIGIIRCHDGDTDVAFRQEVDRRGLSKYPYCVVMPAADRNLQTIISAERIAGRDWVQIKTIGNQVTEALQHMHRNGVMHGDVKPLNIMRCDGRMKLIDLDASASLLNGYSGGKSSSAYVPPCLMHNTGKEIIIRLCPLDPVTKKPITTGLPYEVVPAAYPHDVWALGCVMYELCAGIKLFLQDDEDNIDSDAIYELYNFTDELKRRKLSKISDLQARNLVSQLLSRDPRRRPNFHQILAHPFLSGKRTARMIGDSAEFDVFLSYRVNSDTEHAAFLYDVLTRQGLKVWWDKKCLAPGVPWEIGFTDGLLKSRIFVPILSRGAVNHPTERSQNFSMLESTSDCDSVLLEMRLALELHARDLVEKIYPVFIGDRIMNSDSPGASSKSILSLDEITVAAVSPEDVYGHYFKCGCHPKFTNDDVVASVEAQVRAHLERLCLGCSLLDEMPTAAVVKAIIKNQGHVVDGAIGTAFRKVQQDLLKISVQQHQLEQQERQQIPSQPEGANARVQHSEPQKDSPSSLSVKSLLTPDNGSSPMMSLKGPQSLSPIRVRHIPEDVSIAEIFTFLQECGLRRSKSKQYAQKLVTLNKIDSRKTLLRMYDNVRLMNILNSVMDRQDAEAVGKEIVKFRKSDKGRYRTPDRISGVGNSILSNNMLYPSVSRNILLSQIEGVPSQLPSLAAMAPTSGDSALSQKKVSSLRRATFD